MPYVTDEYGLERLICPNCGGMCHTEYVDIGVGQERVEPWACDGCGWEESVPDIDGALDEYDDEDDIL